jgi:hypothetical protein
MGVGVKLGLLALSCALTLHGATYFVTIAGLGGSPDYEQQFEKWAADADRELKANGPEARVITLCGTSVNKEKIASVLSQIAQTAKPEDAFALFLIGHGSFDGADYKFNIPGPDITAAQIAALLNRIPAHEQLVVNMTSASGASLPFLVRKSRIVITATKSGTEKNATVFPRYWLDALQDPAADTDKNGTVSALEAFRYAEHKTAAYFDSEKLLASEHALFSDTGTKDAVRDPSARNGEGLRAAQFTLKRPNTETAQNLAPAKQKLLARKQEIEAKIDRLKYEKAAMPPDEYKQQLTAMLLELARTQAELDR